MSDLQFCIRDGLRYFVKINMGRICFPMVHNFDWCEREGIWMKIVRGWLSGDQGRLQYCSISAWNVSDQKWQLPYGFKSRHNLHTNKQAAVTYMCIYCSRNQHFHLKTKTGLKSKVKYDWYSDWCFIAIIFLKYPSINVHEWNIFSKL